MLLISFNCYTLPIEADRPCFALEVIYAKPIVQSLSSLLSTSGRLWVDRVSSGSVLKSSSSAQTIRGMNPCEICLNEARWASQKVSATTADFIENSNFYEFSLY